MDFFFNTLKKTLTLTLLIAFITVISYVPLQVDDHETVPQADAIVGIAPQAVFQKPGSPAFIEAVGNLKKETLLDKVAWALSKSIVATITQSTVTWINSGFQGSPAFVQDLDRYLTDIADQAAGRFIDRLGPNNPLSFLCSPFALDIQVALAIEYQTARERIPYRGCRLSEFTGDFERWIEGEFEQGGWETWFRVVSEPEIYTPIGARSEAQRALEENIQAARNEENQNVANAGGFLSFRLCDETQGPGVTSEQDCRVVTPGKTIADRLSDSLGLGEQSLIAADEFNEIIGALMGQLAVQAISGTAGLLGLSQGTGYTYSGFNAGSYVGQAAAQSNTAVTNSLSGSADDLQALLTVQESFLATAQAYNARATTILTQRRGSLDPDELAAINSIVSDTDGVILQANINISSLQTDIAEFQQLEQQLSDPQLTQTEIAQLRNQQLQIIARANSGVNYDQTQVDGFVQNWDAILDNI